MAEPKALLILIEILFPITGMVILVVLSARKTGKERWVLFLSGILAVLLLHLLLFRTGLFAENLLAVAVFGILLLAAYYYYMILILIRLIIFWKSWREEKEERMDTPDT